MTKAEELVVNLSNQELKEAFDNLEEWKYKTGVLREGRYKELRTQWEQETEHKEDARVLEQEVLYQIGRRFSLLVKANLL